MKYALDEIPPRILEKISTMNDIVTGALSTEDKHRYMRYINRLYKDKYLDAVHMTPIEDKVKIEVTFTAQKTHMIKAHPDDSFEEYEYTLGGNDR